MTVHHSKGLTYDVVFTLLNGAFGKAPAVCETGPDWVLEPPAFPDSAQALPAFAAGGRCHAGGVDPAAIGRVILELVVGLAFKNAEIQLDKGLHHDRYQHRIQQPRRFAAASQRTGIHRLHPGIDAFCLTLEQHTPALFGQRLVIGLPDIAAFLVACGQAVPDKYEIQKHIHSPYPKNSEQTASISSRTPCESST